jgi:hypothetical protein
VRQVRNSDKILAVLESETGRLQNLIHRYVNQPGPDLFAEILLLREAILGTLRARASTDPILLGSVDELERATERFLSGFRELRALQTTITKTYENQILTPARDMAGLYSTIEGATSRRHARIWPTLGHRQARGGGRIAGIEAEGRECFARIERGAAQSDRR